EEEQDRTTAQITVFLDASLAVSSHGQAGLEIPGGPRIGPEALSEWLCNGRVDYTVLQGGTPLGVGRNTRVIPPRLRRYVLFRDGGCAVEGCSSRYRLQAHHVLPFSEGGETEAENLVSLCWFHHHVLIHGYGYRIDPESPPGRRRFLRQTRAP
ncbi:MAG TPA: HNH endonuclease signature motif containing protein, partial [Acidimicrobiia bacterium]